MAAADNPNETTGDPRRRPVSDRLVSLSGAAGVALTFGFVALGSHGASPDDPPAEIAAALIDNSDRAEIGALLGLGAALLLMIFVARLHATLKRASDSSHFATLALIGGAPSSRLCSSTSWSSSRRRRPPATLPRLPKCWFR